jgi:hypothetical protein
MFIHRVHSTNVFVFWGFSGSSLFLHNSMLQCVYYSQQVFKSLHCNETYDVEFLGLRHYRDISYRKYGFGVFRKGYQSSLSLSLSLWFSKRFVGTLRKTVFLIPFIWNERCCCCFCLSLKYIRVLLGMRLLTLRYQQSISLLLNFKSVSCVVYLQVYSCCLCLEQFLFLFLKSLRCL